jgi:hypothetical protein
MLAARGLLLEKILSMIRSTPKRERNFLGNFSEF